MWHSRMIACKHIKCSTKCLDTASKMLTDTANKLSEAHSLWNYVVYDYWNENDDPRTRDLPFMSGGPWKIIALMALYVYGCGWLGPRLMQNRPAFKLRRIMFWHNVIAVLLNAYFCVCTIYHLNFGLKLFDFRFPSREIIKPEEMVLSRLFYLYLWTKVYDLFDTVFFVLRKKNNQLSGLHLYHHSLVPILGWIAVKIASTAPCLGAFPILNTVVHMIMYSYYALSALGPSIQPYLWWKKYITQLQLAQFGVWILYLIPFFKYQENYPVKFWMWVAGPQPFIFFYLFWSFYNRTYTEKAKTKTS